MPARHRERYSSSLHKLSTITPEFCPRFAGISVHVALESLSIVSRNTHLGRLQSDPYQIQQAVTVYQQVLEERTRARVPLGWAATQNNLGDAFMEALTELAREGVSRDWAMTQSNLGNALLALGELQSDSSKLQGAVTAYQQALEELTHVRGSLEWALIENNLGSALLSTSPHFQ